MLSFNRFPFSKIIFSFISLSFITCINCYALQEAIEDANELLKDSFPRLVKLSLATKNRVSAHLNLDEKTIIHITHSLPLDVWRHIDTFLSNSFSTTYLRVRLVCKTFKNIIDARFITEFSIGNNYTFEAGRWALSTIYKLCKIHDIEELEENDSDYIDWQGTRFNHREVGFFCGMQVTKTIYIPELVNKLKTSLNSSIANEGYTTLPKSYRQKSHLHYSKRRPLRSKQNLPLIKVY